MKNVDNKIRKHLGMKVNFVLRKELRKQITIEYYDYPQFGNQTHQELFSEIEKRFRYLETQWQNEAKINENFFDELKSIINVLNSKTKKNEILELQAAIERMKKNEDIIIAANIVTNERIEGLKCEITANRSFHVWIPR